jgi:hypothetical protein
LSERRWSRAPARRFEKEGAVRPSPRKCRNPSRFASKVPGRVASPPLGAEVGPSPAAAITLSRLTVLTGTFAGLVFQTFARRFLLRVGFETRRANERANAPASHAEKILPEIQGEGGPRKAQGPGDGVTGRTARPVGHAIKKRVEKMADKLSVRSPRIVGAQPPTKTQRRAPPVR